MESSILRSKLVWLALILLFIGLAFAKVPAQWAAYGLTQAIPGLRLSEVSGSLWKGQANSAHLDVGGDRYALGQIKWQLSALSLLSFNPCASLDMGFQGQTGEGTICASRNKVEFTDLQVHLPAALLGIWFPLNVSGDLSLAITNGEIRGTQIDALDGTLAWRNASYNDGQQWIPVGNFGANLSPDQQGGVNADVRDLGDAGPVMARLTANYNPMLRPGDSVGVLIQGEVDTRNNAHEDLRRVLPQLAQALGGEQTDKGYRLEIQQ